MTNRTLAYVLLALLYLGAAFAALTLWAMIWIADPHGAATILPDWQVRKAIYFAALVAAVAGAAIVHALLARRPSS